MRIALLHDGEVGYRTGQILLGDRRVACVGLVDRSPVDARGGRVIRADDLTGFDVAVTDAPDPTTLLRRAGAAGIPAAVWVDAVDGVPAQGGLTVLVGANLATGIAPCLATHEVARLGPGSTAVIAWTEPGRPLHSGEPIPFPEPVGGRWGRRFEGDAERLVAPVDGEWAGALATVTSRDGGQTRIVGVADLAPHLEALALAAGAMTVASGAYGPGLVTPADAAEAFLSEALAAGLDVAAHSVPAG